VGVLYGSDLNENFTEINYNISKIDRMSGFVSLENVLNRWVSGALPPTPLGSLQRSQDPLAGGQKNTSSQEPHTVWAIRASLFSPSGLAISLDLHNVVDVLAPMPSWTPFLSLTPKLQTTAKHQKQFSHINKQPQK